MLKHALKITSVFLVLIGASAIFKVEAQKSDSDLDLMHAQRSIPSNREQVMLSYAPLVKKVSPAVVNIYTKRTVTRRVSPFMNDPFFEQFFGRSFGFNGLRGGLSKRQVENSLGSGLIIDKDGVVVTNAHVIDGADEISVVLNDGREFDATLSLADKPSDLAILRLEDKAKNLPFARFKPSESLQVGDIVLAIGNPFGVGQTVTSGIVSALSRSTLNINDYNFFIQTDAAINPGNSGGPLVAMDGSVVGINTAIYSRSGGSLGIGFAIPSEMVASVVAAEKTGNVSQGRGIIRPWIGMTGQAVTADIADSLGLNRPQGVLVSSLHPASPLRKANIKAGDVITKVNGRDIRDPAELKFRLATVPIGETAALEILNKGRIRNVRIEAMAPPEDPPRETQTLEGPHPLNGARVSNVNPAVVVELGLQNEEQGIIVTDLPPRSRAARLVDPGDMIVQINDENIEDMDDLEDALNDGVRKGYWNFIFSRDGRRRQVVIR